jgi:hypothetical protein
MIVWERLRSGVRNRADLLQGCARSLFFYRIRIHIARKGKRPSLSEDDLNPVEGTCPT